ncbi:MAG TPA: hypothetical protein VGE39_10640 [Prosthecobacter sp.]
MNELDTLAIHAKAEIESAKQHCTGSSNDADSRAALWGTFRSWISHPDFDKGFNILEKTILNELEFTLADPHLKEEGWTLISELAGRWERENNITMKDSLCIACFEVAAEPPEHAPTLELLFSLATHPETRWAVFAAYEHCPWRLRPHALKYSRGSVTDNDCDQWLIDQGHGDDETLMSHDPRDGEGKAPAP